jgi:hypothetical protein
MTPSALPGHLPNPRSQGNRPVKGSNIAEPPRSYTATPTTANRQDTHPSAPAPGCSSTDVAGPGHSSKPAPTSRSNRPGTIRPRPPATSRPGTVRRPRQPAWPRRGLDPPRQAHPGHRRQSRPTEALPSQVPGKDRAVTAGGVRAGRPGTPPRNPSSRPKDAGRRLSGRAQLAEPGALPGTDNKATTHPDRLIHG